MRGVVRAFKPYVKHVIAGIDQCTSDRSFQEAHRGGAIVTPTAEHGKGQVVKACLRVMNVIDPYSPLIVFCDADITGLSIADVAWLIGGSRGDGNTTSMRVLVPNPTGVPPEWEWKEAYPWVSGIRAVPRAMLQDVQFHGYLVEAQLNAVAKRSGVKVEFYRSATAQAPFRFSAERRIAMSDDYEWGKARGIL